MERINFYDQINKNKFLSFVFLLLAFLFAGFFIWFLSISFGLDVYIMLIVSIILSFIFVYSSYINSHKIALMSVKAFKADEREYKHLHNMVEGLAIAAGIKKPEVYIMPSDEINAFASGRDPEHAVICVTQGALKKLNDSELEGVLAHEMSHIKHYDIRYITIVTVVVGMISLLSEIFLRSLWYRRRDREGSSILIILAIILAILAPIILRLIYLAISRKREFMADAGAVELTRNPKGLINALEKIKQDYLITSKTKISRTLSPMFIADPHSIIRKLFSTHPPIEERIEILKRM